jgi:hypothetical protein
MKPSGHHAPPRTSRQITAFCTGQMRLPRMPALSRGSAVRVGAEVAVRHWCMVIGRVAAEAPPGSWAELSKP